MQEGGDGCAAERVRSLTWMPVTRSATCGSWPSGGSRSLRPRPRRGDRYARPGWRSSGAGARHGQSYGRLCPGPAVVAGRLGHHRGCGDWHAGTFNALERRVVGSLRDSLGDTAREMAGEARSGWLVLAETVFGVGAGGVQVVEGLVGAGGPPLASVARDRVADVAGRARNVVEETAAAGARGREARADRERRHQDHRSHERSTGNLRSADCWRPTHRRLIRSAQMCSGRAKLVRPQRPSARKGSSASSSALQPATAMIRRTSGRHGCARRSRGRA